MKKYKSVFKEALSDNDFINAELVGGKGAIPYGALKKGELFNFSKKDSKGIAQPKSDDIYIKLNGSNFKDKKTNEKYQTGMKTAIIQIK